MFKIKKYVYRVLTIALALLVMLNTAAIGVLAESSDGAVAPGPEDYEFSNGTITGLKAGYLENLTAEQKQNIRLVIPEKIGNVEVTAIGEWAFSLSANNSKYKEKYKGCNFIYLDLSNARYLQSIGEWAFYSNTNMNGSIVLPDGVNEIKSHAFDECKSLMGGLTIPDSVGTIGEYAFSHCENLRGGLKLSNQLTVIPKYTFSYTGFTGNLIIPNTVTSIGDSAFRQEKPYNGFSGTLKIPASVKSIGKVTFTNQRGITGLDLSVCTLDSLGDSVFKGTGLQGCFNIPVNIKTIGDGTFKDTFLETIYLPKNIEVFSNSFDSCDRLSAIVCNQTDYDRLFNKLSSKANNKLGYPITVSFDDGNGGVYENKECLYNLPYNYERDSAGIWTANSNYRFPEIKGTTNKVWGATKGIPVPTTETSNVTSATLYSVDRITNPTITYSSNIDKVYDGQTVTLTATPEHPYLSTKAEASKGNVFLYYRWKWIGVGNITQGPDDFDANTYEITDVRADYPITCRVYVWAYVVDGNNKASIYYSEQHDFTVDLRQADSTVNPTVTSGTYKMSEGQTTLPEIKLSAGDTPGTIAWDADQRLKKGFGIYTWTFTPAPNGVDNNTTSNYKEVKGQVELYATTEELDDKSLEEKIEEIPEPKEEPPTEDEKEKILDAYFAYESSDDSIKEKISEEKQEKIYEAINKLPQVEIGAEGLKLGNEKELLKNLTPQDAAVIKDDEDAKCTIKVISKKETPADEIDDAIKSEAGDNVKIGENFDVSVVKTVGKDNDVKEIVLSTVQKPLTLVFDVPTKLQLSSRKFFIIHAHKNEDGTITAEKLEDQDNNPATITVTSDKFSTYAIAYTEEQSSGGSSGGSSLYTITASAGEHGTISPEGKTYAYYGSSKTFNFTPDEGYEVADVLVDGISVGAASSYTFETITRAHTIAVTFQPIADDQNRIIEGVKATRIKASSTVKKGAITVKWRQSVGFKVDYYQVFRSTKKNKGYGTKAFYTTKSAVQKSYKNTKSLRKGTRYYYKVRGVRTIDGKKVFTQWSNKTWRIAK